MPTKTAVKPTVKKTSKVASVHKVAKVAPKKAVAKKATVKKATKKEPTFKALVCAADGECFWTRDGRILQNLDDLHMAFGSMDEEVFLHHVNKEKNDFADWVEHILDDLDCSVELRKSKELAKAHKILQSHLQKYSVA